MRQRVGSRGASPAIHRSLLCSRTDGSHWSRGASERGNLRSYAPAGRSRSRRAAGEDAKQDAAGPRVVTLRKSEAASWGVRDVCNWLASIGMKEHQRTFFKNKISGACAPPVPNCLR